MGSAFIAERSSRLPDRGWSTGDRRVAGLCAIVTGLFGAHLLISLQILAHRGAYPFGDFYAIWTSAKIAFAGRAADLYDMAQTYAAQIELGLPTAEVLGLPPAPSMPFPFPYAPIFPLLLWPLGSLSYNAAFVLWMVATFTLFACAVCRGARVWRLMLLGVLVAPTTVVNIGFGQTGFLLAALMIGGVRLMDRHPWWAGVLFGLLTYKPQFGIFVPVALVAAGQWRCIAATCATVAALAGGATLAFGVSIWMTWLHSLHSYVEWFENPARTRFARASLRDNLELLGFPADAVSLAQLAVILGGAFVVWVAFRYGRRTLATPIFIAATCLATPHGNIYDLCMLTGAVLLFIDDRVRAESRWSLIEITILLLTLTFPIAGLWSIYLPIGSAVIAVFLALVLSARGADGHSPFRFSRQLPPSLSAWLVRSSSQYGDELLPRRAKRGPVAEPSADGPGSSAGSAAQSP